jgi:hypothetical protein
VTDAGFVIAAWGIAAVAIGGYAARLAVRIRKAERSVPPDPEP